MTQGNRAAPSGPLSGFRQWKTSNLTVGFTVTDTNFTNLIDSSAGNLALSLDTPRLATSSLFFLMVCCCRMTNMAASRQQSLFRLLVDDQSILTPDGGAFTMLQAGQEFESSESSDNTIVIAAIVPPTQLPDAAAHVVQPQAQVTGGTLSVAAANSRNSFSLSVGELVLR